MQFVWALSKALTLQLFSKPLLNYIFITQMKYCSKNRWLRDVASSLPRLYSVFTSNHIGKHKYITALIPTLTSYLYKDKLPYILWNRFFSISLFHFASWILTIKFISLSFFFLWKLIIDPSHNLPSFSTFSWDKLCHIETKWMATEILGSIQKLFRVWYLDCWPEILTSSLGASLVPFLRRAGKEDHLQDVFMLT